MTALFWVSSFDAAVFVIIADSHSGTQETIDVHILGSIMKTYATVFSYSYYVLLIKKSHANIFLFFRAVLFISFNTVIEKYPCQASITKFIYDTV